MSREFIITLLAWVALVGRCMAVGLSTSTSTLEKIIDKQQAIIQELRQTDREKCIDLLIKNEI